jgi:hypothetical protein
MKSKFVLLAAPLVVALAACSGKSTPAAAPTQTVDRVATAAAAALKTAGVVSVVALDGSVPKASPDQGQGWVDFAQTPAPVSFTVATTPGKLASVLSLPTKPLYFKGPGEQKYASIGPKAAKQAQIAQLAPVVDLFGKPLDSLGVSTQLKSAKGFEKVADETLPSGAATHWKAVALPSTVKPVAGNPTGVTSLTESVDVWLNASGFPVRVIQYRNDKTYLGLELSKSTAGTHFVVPPANQVTVLP